LVHSIIMASTMITRAVEIFGESAAPFAVPVGEGKHPAERVAP
jgi:hypothetical protein